MGLEDYLEVSCSYKAPFLGNTIGQHLDLLWLW